MLIGKSKRCLSHNLEEILRFFACLTLDGLEGSFLLQASVLCGSFLCF